MKPWKALSGFIITGTKQGVNPLSWMQSVKIAVTAARGCEFFHEKAEPPIMHSNIKSSNIFLFDDDVAKIGDVVPSGKLLDWDSDSTIDYWYYLSPTIIKGNFGIRDAPEHAMKYLLHATTAPCFKIN